MKKILTILFLSILFLNLSFLDAGAVDNEPIINGLTYEWNLNKSTILSLNWNHFDKCSNLTFEWNDISLLQKTNTNILITYKNISSHTGVVYLVCWDISLWYNFNFPYLRSASYDPENLDRKVFIAWDNLTNSILNVDWWEIITSSESSTKIIWWFSEHINSTEIYVTKDWLKSNLLTIDIKIPVIDFIYSENWFTDWWTIEIHWKNLNYYKNTSLKLEKPDWESEEISDFDVTDNWWILTFPITGLHWEYKIKLFSNWFLAKEENIFIYWNKPVITNVTEKYSIENWNELHIYWKNFSKYDENLKIILNGTEFKWINIDKTTFSIFWYELKEWDNYLTIFWNWYYWNTYNYVESNYGFPKITWLDIWDTEDWLRSMKLAISNFDKANKWDLIYFNNWVVEPVWCTSWFCRFEFPVETLKWEFKVSRDWKISDKIFSFDLTDKYQPRINSITIKWDLLPWSRVTILWDNFLNWTVSSSNFLADLWDNKSWVYDIDMTHNKISWKLSKDFNINQPSNLWINVYWLNENFSFNVSKEWEEIKGNPFISKLESSDYAFNIWSIVKIKWANLWNNPIAFVWDMKTSFDTTTNTLIIPFWVTPGYNILYLESDEWKKSNIFTVYIYPKSTPVTHKLTVNDITNKYFITNELQDNQNKLYDFSVENYVDDIYVKEMIFIVEWLDDFGTFSLFNWWVKIWTSIVNEDGDLVFDVDGFIWNNNINNNFILYKDSPFTSEWDFFVNLEEIKWEYKNINEIVPTFKYSTRTFFYDVIKNSKQTCLDVLDDRFNCNSFLQDSTYVPDNSEEENNNEWLSGISETTNIDTGNTNIQESEVINEAPIEKKKNVKYEFDIIKNKKTSVKNLIVSRWELNKSLKWKKYISQVEPFIENLSENMSYKLLNRIYTAQWKVSWLNSLKHKDLRNLLDFMEARLEVKLID